MPTPPSTPGNVPDDTTGLTAAAAAVTAAQQALSAARRELSAAISAARTAGVPAHRIAEHTGLDAMTVRNILAIPSATTPASRP
ncbi:hypothetical protein PV371_36690 [Streptomyces sp. TX20-6-3]|uniref:hypothetical protein n=1 Tax=Streptomyces sp. TX20-6-3 TaxID=3028705 RepID=UPI00299FF294|nr:hypothetical protein [Streptomyces sp. TX20-6-3]MDX2565163.1 hypothetical protein [Streptomyces sp. TX20-6-3]